MHSSGGLKKSRMLDKVKVFTVRISKMHSNFAIRNRSVEFLSFSF